MNVRASLLWLLVAACAAHARADGAAVKLVPLADRVRVEIGGRLFTEYVYGDGASRSYFYPVFAADGTALTRNFPMRRVPGEDTDHPWHRSMWFAHSMVNGVDFWNEDGGDPGKAPADKGRTVPDGAVETESGSIGVIRVRDRWLAHDGRLVCTDDRTIRFRAAPDGRFIDFDITLLALPDKPLLMGDNKDGTMAVRVATWLNLPRQADNPRKYTGGDGHILTANGYRGEAAWGKRADWCDYYAEHQGKTYGIAIFDNPRNLRHPTWWMARDYGVFAANPFGEHDFEHLKDDPHAGDYLIPAGGALKLRYRFYFHLGDPIAAKVAQCYEDYASGG